MQRAHPTGQTRYKNNMVGHNGYIKYIQKNLNRHININEEIVGIIGLPNALKDATKISLIP